MYIFIKIESNYKYIHMLGLAQKIQLSELTPLWRLIQTYPDKNWSWFWISCNSNITWQIIQNNPDKPWEVLIYLQTLLGKSYKII